MTTFTVPEKARAVPLSKLRPAEWNANRVNAATMKRIRTSIERYGFVENLVARPHPSEEGCFEILSGNHRLQIVGELGFQSVPVVVVELDDPHARLLAQTLNRTRGRDDPAALRQLLADVLAELPLEDITAVLPETPMIQGVAGTLDAVEVPEMWGLIVECKDEADQTKLLEQLLADGYACRALMT